MKLSCLSLCRILHVKSSGRMLQAHAGKTCIIINKYLYHHKSCSIEHIHQCMIDDVANAVTVCINSYYIS